MFTIQGAIWRRKLVAWSGRATKMVMRPYKKPLAQGSDIGRQLTRSFANDCVGERMLQGEKLIRQDKVADIKLYQDYNSGFRVQAKVVSQNPLYCKASQGRYDAFVKLQPYTPEEVQAKVAIIRRSIAWQQLVHHEPSNLDQHAVLEELKFAQVPFELLEKVMDWSSCIHACDRLDADCNCLDDPAVWCKHVASLCYVLVDACEKKPLVFLKCMGIDIQALLDNDRSAARRTSPTRTAAGSTKRERHGWVFSPSDALAKRACSSSYDADEAAPTLLGCGSKEKPFTLP